MTIAFALILTALTFAFVAYPLLKERARPVVSTGDEQLRELHSKRDVSYSMLKELEFDLQSGILSEEDYRDLETRYKKKAIAILKDMDSLAEGANAEDEIEKRVLELRKTENAKVEDKIDRQVRELRKGKTKELFCHQCGTKGETGDRFCSSCGARLREG